MPLLRHQRDRQIAGGGGGVQRAGLHSELRDGQRVEGKEGDGRFGENCFVLDGF